MRLPASKKDSAFCRSPASQMMAEASAAAAAAACGTLAPLPLLSACWPAAGSGSASAPRWGEAVVEHEHALHVEALGDVRHELVRGGREGAVAVEELPAIRPRLSRARQWARVRWAHTSGSCTWRPRALRNNAVTVWNGASAGTLNLAVLRMGASPVCLKLTITFPSLTADADDDIPLPKPRKIVANRARRRR